jgi:nitrous oxidase accessory protein NosD
MTSNVRVTHSALALLLSGVIFPAARAAVLTVGPPGAPCPNPQYGTIGAAISAASPGDVIAICPALYPEQLVITKPLTLQGLAVDGLNRVLIQPSALTVVNGYVAAVSVWNTYGVSLQNLAIDASNTWTAAVPASPPFTSSTPRARSVIAPFRARYWRIQPVARRVP